MRTSAPRVTGPLRFASDVGNISDNNASVIDTPIINIYEKIDRSPFPAVDRHNDPFTGVKCRADKTMRGSLASGANSDLYAHCVRSIISNPCKTRSCKDYTSKVRIRWNTRRQWCGRRATQVQSVYGECISTFFHVFLWAHEQAS